MTAVREVVEVVVVVARTKTVTKMISVVVVEVVTIL